MTCIKMGSNENHFTVSLIIVGQSHETDSVHRPQLWAEEKGELKRIRTEVPLAYQPNALPPLGHTGSHLTHSNKTWCLKSTETIRLIRDGEKGGREVWRRAGREVDFIPITTHVIAMPTFFQAQTSKQQLKPKI